MLIFLCACRHPRQVNTSFYYWKTLYKRDSVTDGYLKHFAVSKLYMRIADVDRQDDGDVVPISPVNFKDSLPAGVQIVPVVFIVNDILRYQYNGDLDQLAARIAGFAKIKVEQSGQNDFKELQIDCDWTATTRDNYFSLLNKLKHRPELTGKTISVTLRLHQLKNLQSCGVPPVSRVMLMCYNMGNLRKYGDQNSILDLNEMKKYAGDNLKKYPLKMDIGLPMFGWAVAFRNKKYIGISKQLSRDSLMDKQRFEAQSANIYRVTTDLPEYGLQADDVVRWETVTPAGLLECSKYLSSKISADTLNIIYFHLDKNPLKTFPYVQLEAINKVWR